jgi:hypothetical protein
MLTAMRAEKFKVHWDGARWVESKKSEINNTAPAAMSKVCHVERVK